MSITVMKQALEAIATGKEKFEAITALRQAIEQAEKVEPVACKPLCELCIKRGYGFCANTAKTTVIPAAPTAPAQPSVTDECGRPMTYWGGKAAPAQDLSHLEPFVHGLGKAILRELQAAPAQPSNHTEQPLDMVKALQPLTDSDIDDIYESFDDPEAPTWIHSFARAIEAHIKGASL